LIISLELQSAAWYAVQTRFRFEMVSATSLVDKGYEVFYPTCHGRGSTEWPLFPCYLFCRSTVHSLGLIVTTPGVIRLLGQRGKPESVPDVEIANVRCLMQSGLPMQDDSGFVAGTHVCISRGPLSGIEGQVTGEAGGCRLAVSISILRRFVSVALDRSWLEVIPVT
jgi:transcription termination/antitermination protein NusG